MYIYIYYFWCLIYHIVMEWILTFSSNSKNLENVHKIYLLKLISQFSQSWIRVSEWLLLNTNSAIFQLYHGENKLIFNETLSWIDMSPTPTHYSDSEPTSLCSFSLMMCALWISHKYQFYSLWFDPISARTYDLPHSRWAC
jgi:hypothetical protein